MYVKWCTLIQYSLSADVVEFDDLIKQVSQVMTIKAWIQLGGRHVRSAAFTKRVSLQELGKQRPPFACNITRFIHGIILSTILHLNLHPILVTKIFVTLCLDALSEEINSPQVNSKVVCIVGPFHLERWYM